MRVTRRLAFAGRTGGTPTPTPVGVGGAISITAVSLPNRLVISQIKFTPSVIRSRSEPLTARFRVTETQAGKAVAGALVNAVGVPANRVTNAGETQTDSSGWATMTFRPLTGLPMKQGAQLVFFVRARKGGENVLAGVRTAAWSRSGSAPGSSTTRIDGTCGGSREAPSAVFRAGA